jgi:hypothetical protein
MFCEVVVHVEYMAVAVGIQRADFDHEPSFQMELEFPQLDAPD